MAKTQDMGNTEKQPEAPKRGKAVESTFAEKWEPQNVGDFVEGRYLGYEVAEGRKDSNFNAYQLLQPDGKRLSMAGAHLDSILPQVPKNTYIWVTYNGSRRMKSGDMKLFTVEVEEGVRLLEVLK